jgi:hypothetical protein
MKVRITHLKAPWPEGALVGDVLEVPEVAPWALGKCVIVGDDEEVTAPASTVDAEALALAEAEKQAAEEIAANAAKPVGPENVTITGTEKPSTGKKK